jgi:hypothetical protein
MRQSSYVRVAPCPVGAEEISPRKAARHRKDACTRERLPARPALARAELLEITHHSPIRYRLPTTGELVPLLQIAPSKTHTERLLVVSSELADVLSAIISRVRDGHEAVPLVRAYDRHECAWLGPSPFLFQRKWAAQIIAGHQDINVTLGYKAVYPDEAIQAHLAFLARRRALRPIEEYRVPTNEEWAKFLGHFERRKVATGTCGRAFGTPCIHEHSCLPCSMHWPDTAQRPRIAELRDNLIARIVGVPSVPAPRQPHDPPHPWSDSSAMSEFRECTAWPSACSAWTATPTSPPPTAATPVTRSAGYWPALLVAVHRVTPPGLRV